jgi:hypothetical protein
MAIRNTMKQMADKKKDRKNIHYWRMSVFKATTL